MSLPDSNPSSRPDGLRDLLEYLRERYADAEPALAELDAIETATVGLVDAMRRGHEHEVDEALSALVSAVFPTGTPHESDEP